MSRTAELQSITQAVITDAGHTAYADEAPDNATYPYVVYSINSFSYEDIRDDIILDIDIWDYYANYSRVEAMADAIEAAFEGLVVHDDAATVLPQFFRYIRTKVPDTDKKIKRINLKFEIQNYAHKAHEAEEET